MVRPTRSRAAWGPWSRRARATPQAYIKALEEMTGAPTSAIGVGLGRTETIEINSFL
ncbi:hypothetical protein M8Z33_00040 [Streptomyces sp. ZAF1911]|uniref:hypothetical protein n=1 Tax=Streptomyces sp. ZAF1911 TaxID=2944129 RepID=UPI00237C0693|nr:hypothetical protein [Streptomyces sp. ZAF1911]MDD9375091.1 hypothetical protein [Streptomyces sp. ZAF1911]